MSTPTVGVGPRTLLDEYAAELTREPDAIAAGLGPRPRQAGIEPHKPSEGPAEANLKMVMRIPVNLKIVLGSATMPVANLVKLGPGAVIPLDRRVGEPVDVVVNGRLVARGEVVVVDEATSRFGIKLTEVVGRSDGDKGA